MPRKKKDPTTIPLKTFLIMTLRRSSYRWKPRNEALSNARVDRGIYACAMCHGHHPRKEVKIDHIEPIVPVETGFTTWDSYIDRMFCDVDGFQVLCEACHKSKTDVEQQLRKQYKKIRKDAENE